MLAPLLRTCIINIVSQLGVQIIEICLATRERNGGINVYIHVHILFLDRKIVLVHSSIHVIFAHHSFTGLMSFEELRKRILATSGKTRQDVSEDDMARAIKKLRVLGGGFAVIPIGKHRLVQSVPGELNMDHTAVLQKAEVGGGIHMMVM